MIFSRRRPGPFDPLLTRPRVAELIDRDPARVTRYFQADLMPDPDEILEGGVPAWRRSTIRSWWLRRGGHLDREAARYHSQWEQQDLEAELLEERIVDISFSTSQISRLHIRAYRAMDGGGPVILMGWLDRQRRRSSWSAVLSQLRTIMILDVDLLHPVWISVAVEQPPFSGRSDESMPDVRLTDVENDAVTVTPEDISRLIGRPFDIYPVDLYTEEAVAARRRSGGQDGPAPTAVLTDDDGIGQRMQHLRNLTKADVISADVEADRFAAGLIAGDLREVDNRLGQSAKFRIGHAERTLSDEKLADEAVASAVYLAAFRQARRLSAHEIQIVRQFELESPLIQSESVNDSDERTITLRPDAYQYLDRIRIVLLDPDLTDRDPRRAALTAAEQLLATTVRRADPVFAAADRPHLTYTWSASSTEMAAYLAQLRPVTEEALPRHLKRRARSLLNYEFVQTWTQVVLLHDEQSDLLAMTGLEPSDVDEATARQWVEDLRADHRRAGQEFPHTPATEQVLVEAYMADRAKVHMEWTQALTPVGRDIIAGARLIAPPAGEPERPVFLVTAHGQFLPLSLNGDTHFHGFVWGVSGTDTLTPAVHRLLTSAPIHDWRSYEREEDDPSYRAYQWLLGKRIACSADRLDLNLDEILPHYSDLPPVVGIAAAERAR